MKPFKSVEETRKTYHQFPERNSVHRASAIFPIFDRAHYGNNLTFLNHWLVKRGIPEIAARHTIRDADGTRLGQVYSVVDQKKAYSIDLEEVMSSAGIEDDLRTGSWEVEYFSARNMFIPYPAVVQNVHNDGFVNQVHAYARVLNDFDEDRAVNQMKVSEASVDVVIDEAHDTFVTLINGPVAAKGEKVVFRLADEAGTMETREISYDAAPFETTTLYLSEVFGADFGVVRKDRSLTVDQPYLGLFYNRLFAGIVQRGGDRALSANHSYYDNSGVREYFDADPARDRHANMTLPLIPDLPLTARLYPIVSPADLDFHAAYYDAAGDRITLRENIAKMSADGGSEIIEVMLSDLAPGPEATAVDFFVTTPGAGVPTRITLQVCYGKQGRLATSINLSMHSPYVFVPEHKVGLNWMAVCGLPDIENRVAICHTSPIPDDATHDVRATLYRDQDEEVLTTDLTLVGHSGFGEELSSLMPGYKEFLGGRNGFIYLESKSPFLRSLTIQTHSRTGHSAGEHSF
jgi:hypothetical protein